MILLGRTINTSAVYNSGNNPPIIRLRKTLVETRSKYKYFLVTWKINFENLVVDQLKSTLKLFYSFIRHKKVGCPTLGPKESSVNMNNQQTFP